MPNYILITVNCVCRSIISTANAAICCIHIAWWHHEVFQLMWFRVVDKFWLSSLWSNFIATFEPSQCSRVFLKLMGQCLQKKQIGQNFSIQTTLSVLQRKQDFCSGNPKVDKSVTMITSKFLAAKTVDYGLSLMQLEHHDFHKHSYGFAALATKELFLLM